MKKILQGAALPIIKSKIKRKLNKNILLIPSSIDYYIFKNELKRTDKANEDLAIIDDFMNNLDDKLKKFMFKTHPIEIRKRIFIL